MGLERNQWLGIGILSGMAYLFGKERGEAESFGAEGRSFEVRDLEGNTYTLKQVSDVQLNEMKAFGDDRAYNKNIFFVDGMNGIAFYEGDRASWFGGLDYDEPKTTVIDEEGQKYDMWEKYLMEEIAEEKYMETGRGPYGFDDTNVYMTYFIMFLRDNNDEPINPQQFGFNAESFEAEKIPMPKLVGWEESEEVGGHYGALGRPIITVQHTIIGPRGGKTVEEVIYEANSKHSRMVRNAESFEAGDTKYADIEKLLESDEDVFLGTGDGFKPDHPQKERIIEYLTQGGGGQTPYRVCFTCSVVTPDWLLINEGYECMPCSEMNRTDYEKRRWGSDAESFGAEEMNLEEYEKMSWKTPSDELEDAVENLVAEVKRLRLRLEAHKL